MPPELRSDEPASRPVQKFGTFLGVYTPSVLTILGLIMYLRFGWVVGNVGLPLTVLIVLLASSVTFVTGLSASALATNMRVGVGGEYYLIAHSLGLELGGAIGIPLFLCRTLSITFYSFGLAEAVFAIWPASWGALPDNATQLFAAIIVVLITAIAGRSAELTLKLQIPIMIAVVLSMVALLAGVLSSGVEAPVVDATYSTAPEGFWYVFAVFFPAVTGFTAGIGLSGDLKDPQRSIPRGTLLAVVTGTVAYLVIPVVLASSSAVSLELLAEPGAGSWIAVGVAGAWLAYPGMWGAIVSSAFGSALGGPRVLQALAHDGLAPHFLARTSKSGQPTIATWVTGAIALAAVALGGLNMVARFVTILFLTLYVAINLSAAIEKWAGDPSYRPTINVPWFVSLLGSLGAIIVMFLISPTSCAAAIVLELALYLYLRRLSLQRRWGDARAGLWAALARFALLQLHGHESDPRNWRPQILVFVGNAAKRIDLVRLASWFSQNRGIVTACQLVAGDLGSDEVDIQAAKAEMDRTLDAEGVLAFSEVNVVKTFESGVVSVAQANGMAGLQSNAVMFGFPEKKYRLESQLRIMRALSKAQKSTIIARPHWAHQPGQTKRIDVWWGGRQNNGDMMLLLAYLLNRNPEWVDAKVVVRSIVDSEESRESMTKALEKLIPEVRIEAVCEVIVKPDEQTIAEVIHTHSRSADVVFLGLGQPEPGDEHDYADRLMELTSGLNTTVFVHNASEAAGRLI